MIQKINFFQKYKCYKKGLYLVNIMHSRESVKSEVHGVKHEDNFDGFTHGTDISEGHHVTEKYGALFEFSYRVHKHKDIQTSY